MRLNSFALLLHRMMNRVRQSLELPEILSATAAEVRAFLGTDRVKIYQFHEDGSGEVVAEAIHDRRLPSLLRHNFPAEDIPVEARELFRAVRQRSIVDVTTQTIGVSCLADEAIEGDLGGHVSFRSVDPCHVEYLMAMGVKSSLVIPILTQEQLWGLLVSHHSQPRHFKQQELQVVQLVADEVAIAITQANLLQQTRQRVAQEATINQIASLLHATPQIQLQAALEQTVTALQGSGGRLYLTPQAAYPTAQLFVYQNQPATPETWLSSRDAQEPHFDMSVSAEMFNGMIHGNKQSADPVPPDLPTSSSSSILEQHPYWQTWLDMEAATIAEDPIWAITDILQAAMPSDLATAFLATQIRGLLIVRLQHHQQTLGYLSVFRGEIDVERIWAGQINWDDPRQLRPRQSFETWRELKKGQAHPWTAADIELIRALTQHFATAIYQSFLYDQVCALNADLKQDIQRRKQAERKISALNAQLEQRVSERTAQLQRTNEELLRQITNREQALQERQQAEALLERLSRQHQLILNSAGEGIYGLNPQGKVTFVNPAAARMLGYEVEEIIGQWMHRLLNHSKPDGTAYLFAESPIYATLQQGTIQHQNGDIFWRRDGTNFPVEYVSSPIREQDKTVGAVVLFKDITERQHLERIKDEFVSIVSHELRTPLTSIRSTLGLLSSGWLSSYPEKSQRMLEIASSNTNRLVRLIDDILDVERIKFGKVKMEKRSCNAADLMIQSTDAMRAMAEKAEIILSVIPISASLWVDPDRIIQTFTNLLNNAIKFSPSNTTVSLTAEVMTPEPEKEEQRKKGGKKAPKKLPQSVTTLSPRFITSSPYILFRVKDEGQGIPEDKLETIFDRFQQVDTSNSRSQGGTGLGLTICRGIIQQHGGQIWVESTLGEGSTFCFTLPLVEADQQVNAE